MRHRISYLLAWAFLGGSLLAADCSLKLESDGTATVRGEVVRNDQGCRVDVSCYLQLTCEGQDWRVIYHPGEGPVNEIKNEVAPNIAGRVGPGDVIEAHGGYSKVKAGAEVEIYSKASYWIKVLEKGSLVSSLRPTQ